MVVNERTTMILIRHAESCPRPDVPEADWCLSSRGHGQSEELADRLAGAGIGVIVSSPYRRAIDTVRPLAARLHSTIIIRRDLRERKLCEGMRDDWQELIKRAWSDFSFALSGCESGFACQKRVLACLAGLATEYAGQKVAVCSHGNAIGLLLNSIDRTFGYANWQSMKTPDVFRIDWDAGRGQWCKG